MKDLIQRARHYFYVIKDGKWYIGFHRDVPKDHKFVSYYSVYYDGYLRSLWIWRFCIENHY